MINLFEKTDAVIDKVEDLRHNAESRIFAVTDCKAPTFGDLELYPRFNYRFDGIEYKLRDMKFQCYMAKNIPYIRKSNESKEIYIDSMINCITKKLIYPFVLFIQGKFIPWTNITVVKDYFYSYLLIYGYEDFNVFDEYSSIFFPCYIKYGENSLLYKSNSNPAFLFDSNGLLTLSTDNLIGRVEVIDKNVSGKDYRITEDKPYFIVETDKIPISVESIIVFKDGEPFKEGLSRIVDKGANVFYYQKAPEDTYSFDSILIRVYYNTTSNTSYSNIYNDDIVLAEIQDDLINEILTGETKEYFPYIKDTFDFDHSRKISYNENIKNSIKYILDYNTSLLTDAMREEATIHEVQYYGSDILSMMDENNYLTMFRRNIEENTDTYVIIFRNNRLFELYNTIEYENNKFKLFMGNDIKEDDQFEFIYFEFVNNHPVEVVINEGETLHTSEFYDLDDCELYSKEVENPVYNLYSEKDHLQYKVDFEFTSDDEYNNNITLNDPWFYGKTLTLSSKRQFRYCWNNITSDRLTISLSPDFKFCQDLNHYIVFVNGRKLDPDQIERISKPDENLPFDELCLYSNVPLRKGDIVDIFYVPEVFESLVDNNVQPVYHEDEPDYVSFSIFSPGNIASNLIDKNLCYLFINGYKVNPLSIVSLGNGSFRINLQGSEIDSITLFTYGIFSDLIYYNATADPDKRSKLMDLLFQDDIYNSKASYLVETTGVDVGGLTRDVMTTTKAVVYEMVHNFYNVDGISNTRTNEFDYSYTTEVLDTFDVDENGNYIIRALDGNINDKAPIYNTSDYEMDDKPSYNYEEEEESHG